MSTMTEQGIGSALQSSENHFRAIGRNEGPEAERRARAAASGQLYMPEEAGGAKTVEALLALVSDPAAAKARHAELAAATDEAKRAVAEANAAREALLAERAAHRAALDDADAAHRATIARREESSMRDTRRESGNWLCAKPRTERPKRATLRRSRSLPPPRPTSSVACITSALRRLDGSV
jgi:hypothetical protein